MLKTASTPSTASQSACCAGATFRNGHLVERAEDVMAA
jgi:hypothetical protein